MVLDNVLDSFKIKFHFLKRMLSFCKSFLTNKTKASRRYLAWVTATFILIAYSLILSFRGIPPNTNVVVSPYDEKISSFNPSNQQHIMTERMNNIIVSYAVYFPQNQMSENACRLCIDNFKHFMSKGIINHAKVSYVFILLGKTVLTTDQSLYLNSYSNVKIVEMKNNRRLDLSAHSYTVEVYKTKASLFMLLNCEARGPYFSQLIADSIRVLHSKFGSNIDKNILPWLTPFTNELSAHTRAVGSTISCEGSVHIQSYALLVDAVAADILHNMLNRSLLVSTNSDIEFSKQLLSRGFNIAGLDSRYNRVDFTKYNICHDEQQQMQANGWPQHYLNPVACPISEKYVQTRNATALYAALPAQGCYGQDVCEVIFAKYGGDEVRKKVLPRYTLRRIRSEERITSRVCTSIVPPVRPYPRIELIFNQSSLWLTHPLTLAGQAVDINSTLVIIVRAHIGYLSGTRSLLNTLESTQLLNILVIILPTDYSSVGAFVDAYKSYYSAKIKVRIFISPLHIYDMSNFTRGKPVCSKRIVALYRYYRATDDAIKARCQIKSFMHYFLVDLVLHYIINFCVHCQWLLVTNGDNGYSPRFFNELIAARGNSSTYDVLMSNMLTRGKILEVKAKRGYIDLGSFVSSISFLKQTRTYFLNSLPSRTGPHEFHDTDGYFAERLIVAYKARVFKDHRFLFFHD